MPRVDPPDAGGFVAVVVVVVVVVAVARGREGDGLRGGAKSTEISESVRQTARPGDTSSTWRMWSVSSNEIFMMSPEVRAT